MSSGISDLAHLYRRAGFGATPTELAAASVAGFASTAKAWVDGLGSPDAAAEQIQPPDLVVVPSSFAPYPAGSEARRERHPPPRRHRAAIRSFASWPGASPITTRMAELLLPGPASSGARSPRQTPVRYPELAASDSLPLGPAGRETSEAMSMIDPTRARTVGTATSAFGVGRRENHDSTEFYARFEKPELSADEAIDPLRDLEQGTAACIRADSRNMVLPDGGQLPDNSVALVVTSPPYFSGKEYEQALGQGDIPGSYLEYLQMLREVFAECKRVLEPGGRIAVNVANLGRKPYRSLSSDVVRILQDDLRLLLRGEVIWRKGEGASGSCAWGSFRSAANPVLRDVTERVIVACKGRFDRAKSLEARRVLGLPHESEISPDEFMEATLDVWNIAPESAKRVGHPAPFPVELPQRLIGLYTFKGDLVLDPFMGSGTTPVAAIRAGRRYLAYDSDAQYVRTARRRVKEELKKQAPLRVVASSRPSARRRERPDESAFDQSAIHDDSMAKAAKEGKVALEIAEDLLVGCGFRITHRNSRVRGLGVTVSLVALSADDVSWYFDVSGGFTTTKGGLLRTEAVWRSLGRASVMANNGRTPVVLVTSHLPRPKGEGDVAIRAAGPSVVFDVIAMLADDRLERLKRYAEGGHHTAPDPGFWTEKELVQKRG